MKKEKARKIFWVVTLAVTVMTIIFAGISVPKAKQESQDEPHHAAASPAAVSEKALAIKYHH